ncbi:hypothetical protein COY17_03160 [Candidatus Saccharibacteria bacterium CG_4_10_14_0_2_um_filter_52_9]|nr:MAG: hypothetical protein COY17_03160 [Candidatus Saccharibacteria bacterium CG_4_10_14_0_2_um_filter_52_9]
MRPKNIDFEAFSLENPKHQLAQKQLETWTGQPDGVLLLNEQTIDSHPYGIAAFHKHSGDTLGYIAITAIFLPEMVKLGGFVVNPEYVGQGIGKTLTRYMLASVHKRLPEVEIITAQVNRASKRIFGQYGAIVASERSVYWYLTKTPPTDDDFSLSRHGKE